ncbi:MAG: glycoside hydrolase family 13 protein [Lachnospiraceae bacterium]|nr:glycoside hydrolase family 13 protein [Lachnospiraceae bacterium]
MNLAAIYHRATDQFCYPLNENELIINLQTGDDVDRVYLYEGDPYLAGIMGGKEKWAGARYEIYYKKRLKHHIWWTTTMRPQFKRSKYYFELHSGDEVWYYFEDGFYTEEEMNHEGKDLALFQFPWMNEADIFRTPSWVNATIWYQIFPERFCNGDPSNDPEGCLPWKSEPQTNHRSYYGGDLQGIIDKVPYLQDLGITGLYLTPVFEADSNHKYNTKDYRKVDPAFGTNETLRQLVDACHEAGIRVMLDGVFNHTGTDFPMWRDVMEKGRDSEYADWYMINRWPVELGRDTKDGRYYSFAFSDQMPKLDTNHPAVRKYLLDIVEFWMNTFDIDGLRLDVGNEISHRFLKELRIRCKAKKPDFYLLGEIWHDSMDWLRGDEYDGVMNYPLSTAINNFWVFEHWKKEEFEYAINKSFTTYMQQANDVLFNLLDSHDTSRLMHKVGNDLDVFYQQLAVLYTMPGCPCIFYGTEVAMEGAHDPDCRRCMPWEEMDAGVYDDRIRDLKELIALRKAHPAFRSRNFHFPNEIDDARVIEFMKLSEEEVVRIVLNCGTEDVGISVDAGRQLYARGYDSGVLSPKGILIYSE